MSDTADAIVAALAKADPVGYWDGYSTYSCTLCKASASDYDGMAQDDHEPECPWRRAKELATP